MGLEGLSQKNGFSGLVTQNGFRDLITRKMVLEGSSHTKWVRGFITRRTVLEGDHRSFSNIQTKISRHTIYFGVVYCAANPSQFQ